MAEKKTTQKPVKHESLAQALVAFQGMAPVIEPGNTVKGKTFSYQYAAWSDIQQKIRPALVACGLSCYHRMNVAGDKQVIIAVVQHESGEYLDSMMIMEPKANPQDYGSLISYYKRYSAVALLGIAVGEEDDDGQKAAKSGKKSKPAINNSLLLEKYRSQIYACKTRTARKTWWDKNKGDVLEAGGEIEEKVSEYMAQAAMKETMI